MRYFQKHRSIIFCFVIFFMTVTTQNAFSKETASDLITKMIEIFDGLVNYSAEITTHEKKSQTRIQYFYQKPGYTKMVFIEPHSGATLTYNPKTDKVLLHPFKYLRSVSLSLSPDNSLIQSPRGHSVDKSNIGCLLETMKELQNNGTTKIISKTKGPAGDKIIFEVTGNNNFSIDNINKYKVEFNSEQYFPTEVKAYSSGGELIEYMKLSDIKIDQTFPSDTFNH